MNMPLTLGLMVAVLAAGGAFFIGRTLVTASVQYREHFEQKAQRNLAEMFLLINPQKLFAQNLSVLALTFFVVLLFSGPVFAIVAAVAASVSPPLIYWVMRQRRRRRAVSQLPDALRAIATNLRSGLSLNQALETTIAYEQPPLVNELSLVLRELRIGVGFNETMDNLSRRLPETEVHLVTSAMKVSREIGGGLAETLERIADTLRKRLQMEGKIRSLTAQGKMQGWVMVLLPVFLIVALSQMQPAAMHYMFHAWYGWATIAGIVVVEAIGYHFIRKIVNIDV